MGRARDGNGSPRRLGEILIEKCRGFCQTALLMSLLQTPGHNAMRSFLRVAGPAVAVVGLIFLIIGMASFFSAFGGGGRPTLFWCCFVGMSLLFVGVVLSMFGYMGSVARYTAAEQVPVATDAINDIADGTGRAVKTLSRAVAEGIQEAQPDKKRPPPPRA